MTACWAQATDAATAAQSATKSALLQWQSLDEPGSGGAMTDLVVSLHNSKRRGADFGSRAGRKVNFAMGIPQLQKPG